MGLLCLPCKGCKGITSTGAVRMEVCLHVTKTIFRKDSLHILDTLSNTILSPQSSLSLTSSLSSRLPVCEGGGVPFLYRGEKGVSQAESTRSTSSTFQSAFFVWGVDLSLYDDIGKNKHLIYIGKTIFM